MASDDTVDDDDDDIFSSTIDVSLYMFMCTLIEKGRCLNDNYCLFFIRGNPFELFDSRRI